jgi:hypothetical protein
LKGERKYIIVHMVVDRMGLRVGGSEGSTKIGLGFAPDLIIVN